MRQLWDAYGEIMPQIGCLLPCTNGSSSFHHCDVIRIDVTGEALGLSGLGIAQCYVGQPRIRP